MSSITKKYNINGPVNIIRLENSKNKKIIYLFGDFHNVVGQENECDGRGKETIDVDKFFQKLFIKESRKQFDFFIETFQNDFVNDYYTYKSNYLNQVRKLVTSQINIKDNKVQTATDYKNVRFHYFDVRDMLLNVSMLYWEPKNINLPFNLSQINYYKSIINSEINNINLFLTNIKNNGNIKKIREKYNNTTTKKIIVSRMDIYINNVKNLIKEYNNINEELDTNARLISTNYYDEKDIIKMQTSIYLKLTSTIDEFRNNITFLTDLFLIRRFLEKDYINNSIVYCGASHMTHIAYILVKLFDYNITNISYSRVNIEKLNQEIKKMNTIDNNYLFYLLYIGYYSDPRPIYQCSTLESFPDNLS
jgi:hypothetical protein